MKNLENSKHINSTGPKKSAGGGGLSPLRFLLTCIFHELKKKIKLKNSTKFKTL